MSALQKTGGREKRAQKKARLYCVIESRFYYFLIDQLDAVEPLSAFFPIPFSSGDLLGLSVHDGMALPLFQLDKDKRPGVPPARVTLRIRTSKGLIRLLAASITEKPLMEEKDYAKGIDLAEQLAAILAGTATPSLAPLAISASQTSRDDDCKFLVVRSAGSYFALSANHVAFIEHPEFINPMPHGDPDEIIVGASGTTIAGKSLALWNDKTSTTDNDRWALRLTTRGTRRSLSVEHIVGIKKTPRDSVQRLQIGERETIWYRDEELGTVECLELAKIFGALPGLESEQGGWGVSDDENNEGLLTLGAGMPEAWVGLSIGPYNFILPNDLIIDVIGRVSLKHLKQKGHPGHIPTYDVGSILLPDSAGGRDAGWSAICIRKMQDQCVLIADELIALRDDLPWHPAPALPEPLQSVVQSVRIREGKTEFLVKSDLFENIPPDLLSQMAQTSLRGWIRKFRAESANGKSS